MLYFTVALSGILYFSYSFSYLSLSLSLPHSFSLSLSLSLALTLCSLSLYFFRSYAKFSSIFYYCKKNYSVDKRICSISECFPAVAECSAAEDAQQIYSLHINQLVDFFQGDGANNNKDKLSRKKRKREKERERETREKREREREGGIKIRSNC